MRKLRVALVILLLLTFIAAASAKAALQSMGDALSIGKSREMLQNIEKKLASGSSDIGRINQELSDYTWDRAMQSIANAAKAPAANKTKSTVKPPSASGHGMPLEGIGEAIKALGSINMKIRAPVEIAKGIDIPRLAII